VKSCILALLLLLALRSAFAATDANLSRAALAGELVNLKNHRVLRLSGNDMTERGFAEGYLLAADIRDDLDAAIQSLPTFSAAKFETKVAPWARKTFVWDADARAELDGIFQGMSAKLGAEGLKSKALGRALTRDDIVAMNVIADYFGPACSGFAAWGSRTQGGEVVYGRSLDFPLGPKAIADQIILVSEAVSARADGRPARRAWVGVGWPGLIGQYSAMNAEGFAVCLHDGYNLHKGGKEEGAISRGLLLRRMIEEIGVADGDPAESAARMAGLQSAACGNLFQLVWPKAVAAKTGTQPSAVLEFDSSSRRVDIRRPELKDELVLTNHMRVRSKPVACGRFSKISEGLDLLEKASRPIGLMEARKLLMAAEQPVAAHSIYFFPDRLELDIAITNGNVMSPRVVPTAFTMDELLRK
jgi:hypothetical protein